MGYEWNLARKLFSILLQCVCCVYVCMYACIYGVYVCVCVYVCVICVYVYVCLCCVCMCVCVYVCVSCVCMMCVYICACSTSVTLIFISLYYKQNSKAPLSGSSPLSATIDPAPLPPAPTSNSSSESPPCSDLATSPSTSQY